MLENHSVFESDITDFDKINFLTYVDTSATEVSSTFRNLINGLRVRGFQTSKHFSHSAVI